MELIGARSGNCIDRRSPRATIFGAEIVGLYFEFADGIYSQGGAQRSAARLVIPETHDIGAIQ